MVRGLQELPNPCEPTGLLCRSPPLVTIKTNVTESGPYILLFCSILLFFT